MADYNTIDSNATESISDMSLKEFVDRLATNAKLTFRDCIRVDNIFDGTCSRFKVEVIINYKNKKANQTVILELFIHKIKKTIWVEKIHLNRQTYSKLLQWIAELSINRVRIYFDEKDFNISQFATTPHAVLCIRPHRFITDSGTEEDRNFYYIDTDGMIYDGIDNGRFSALVCESDENTILKNKIINKLVKLGFSKRIVPEPSYNHFCINGVKTRYIYTKNDISIALTGGYIYITTRPVGPGVVNHEWSKFTMHENVLDNEIYEYLISMQEPKLYCVSPVEEE